MGIIKFCVLFSSIPAGVKYDGCYRIDDVYIFDRSSTIYNIPPCMCVTHCKTQLTGFPYAGSFNE